MQNEEPIYRSCLVSGCALSACLELTALDELSFHLFLVMSSSPSDGCHLSNQNCLAKVLWSTGIQVFQLPSPRDGQDLATCTWSSTSSSCYNAWGTSVTLPGSPPVLAAQAQVNCSMRLVQYFALEDSAVQRTYAER